VSAELRAEIALDMDPRDLVVRLQIPRLSHDSVERRTCSGLLLF
jgi:hypothetical protein